MRSSIDINAFSGMNNVKKKERLFVADGVAEPAMILNADVTDGGRLEIRSGTTLRTSLPGANSLWAGNFCILCSAQNVLYRINQDIATPIGNVVGVSEEFPLSYVEVENKVYISNRHYQGVFDSIAGTLNSWGIPLPPGPMLTTTSGNLQPGIYRVCFTNLSGNEISGNGPIAEIELETESGIQILNLPSEAIVWVTDPNESIFYPVGNTSQIVGPPNNVEPLPSFLCSPPRYMENLAYVFGRIWGSVGPVVYYSEPMRFGWFKLQSNYFRFESDVTMIAMVPTGLFIGTNEHTWFMGGTEPEKMSQFHAGAGSIPGSLAYCNNLPELGDVLGTPEKGYVNVPVWRTKEGIVAGNAAGRLYNLTKGKIVMGNPERSASAYMDSGGGVFKFITSSRMSRIGFSDSATCEVMRNGVLI